MAKEDARPAAGSPKSLSGLLPFIRPYRLQVALAGINLYLFGRVLGLRRIPALYAGVVYMFSGFLIVSVVFTMFLAAVPWLPLLLAVIEYICLLYTSPSPRD